MCRDAVADRIAALSGRGYKWAPSSKRNLLHGSPRALSDGALRARGEWSDLRNVRSRVQCIMRIASYSDFRRNLAAALDRVNADHEPLVITRDRGKPMAVLMSLEDFASLEETRHLLRSAENAERLLESIGELERGGGTERTIDA